MDADNLDHTRYESGVKCVQGRMIRLAGRGGWKCGYSTYRGLGYEENFDGLADTPERQKSAERDVE